MDNKENGKLDTKSILLIFLSAILIMVCIFSYNKVDTHKDELKLLNDKYKKIEANIDSLTKVNASIDEKNKEIDISINKTTDELKKVDETIKKLKEDDKKVSTYVRTLNADGIANAIQEYLNKK